MSQQTTGQRAVTILYRDVSEQPALISSGRVPKRVNELTEIHGPNLRLYHGKAVREGEYSAIFTWTGDSTRLQKANDFAARVVDLPLVERVAIGPTGVEETVEKPAPPKPQDHYEING